MEKLSIARAEALRLTDLVCNDLKKPIHEKLNPELMPAWWQAVSAWKQARIDVFG